MKTRTALAALTLTATFALVGCGAAEQSTPSTTTTTYRSTTSTTVAKYDNAMSEYLRKMRTRFPGNNDTQLIEVGEQSCLVIETSGSITDAILMIAEDPTWSSEMAGNAGFTIGAAVPVLCPEYLPELRRITQ